MKPADLNEPETIDLCDGRTPLATGELAIIEECGCGTLHLHIGGLTIRLTPKALSSLLDTVQTAIVEQTVRRGLKRSVLQRIN
jgi:hypothetical protein